jgi:hypothetical protein
LSGLLLVSLYQAVQEIDKIKFDFKQFEGQHLEFVRKLSSQIPYYFGKSVLIDAEVIHEFNYNNLKKILDEELKVENLNIIIIVSYHSKLIKE